MQTSIGLGEILASMWVLASFLQARVANSMLTSSEGLGAEIRKPTLFCLDPFDGNGSTFLPAGLQ